MKKNGPSILVIDTSSDNVSFIAMVDESTLFSYNRRARFGASNLLASLSKKLVTCGVSLNIFDAIAVGKGPGSFTGLRIGYSVVKAMCLALDKPMIIADSLAACALSVQSEKEKAVILDARRGMVYTSIFKTHNGGYDYIQKEQLTTLPEFMKIYRGELIITYDDTIRVLIKKQYPSADILERNIYPNAKFLLESVIMRYKVNNFVNINQVEPLYLHPRDCQVRGKNLKK